MAAGADSKSSRNPRRRRQPDFPKDSVREGYVSGVFLFMRQTCGTWSRSEPRKTRLMPGPFEGFRVKPQTVLQIDTAYQQMINRSLAPFKNPVSNIVTCPQIGIASQPAHGEQPDLMNVPSKARIHPRAPRSTHLWAISLKPGSRSLFRTGLCP